MSIENNRLFLDFDSTLAHTLFANNRTHADQLLDIYSEYWMGEKFEIEDDDWYVTFKRSWTDELIRWSRQLLGVDNVYILSTGSLDYIRWCNIKINLKFDPTTNIFGKEDLLNTVGTFIKFKDTFNVLVDDLTYWEHCGEISKVSFLGEIPDTQFIKVSPFTVWRFQTIEEEREELESIKGEILKAFNI